MTVYLPVPATTSQVGNHEIGIRPWPHVDDLYRDFIEEQFPEGRWTVSLGYVVDSRVFWSRWPAVVCSWTEEESQRRMDAGWTRTRSKANDNARRLA